MEHQVIRLRNEPSVVLALVRGGIGIDESAHLSPRLKGAAVELKLEHRVSRANVARVRAYAREEKFEDEGAEGGVLVASVGKHGGEVRTGRGAIAEHRDLLNQGENGLQARAASASVPPHQCGRSVLGRGRAEVGKDAADRLYGNRNVRWARLQLSETAVKVVRNTALALKGVRTVCQRGSRCSQRRRRTGRCPRGPRAAGTRTTLTILSESRLVDMRKRTCKAGRGVSDGDLTEDPQSDVIGGAIGELVVVNERLEVCREA